MFGSPATHSVSSREGGAESVPPMKDAMEIVPFYNFFGGRQEEVVGIVVEKLRTKWNAVKRLRDEE